MQVYGYTAAVLKLAGWGAVRDLSAAALQCALLELYSDASGRAAARQPEVAPGKKRKRQKAQAQQDDLAALAKGAPAPGSYQVRCVPAAPEKGNAASCFQSAIQPGAILALSASR